MTLASLSTLASHGAGFDHPDSNVDDLREALQDLQGLKMTIISGGSAGDHTVTGIDTEDHLIAVLHLVGDGTQLTGANNDLTSEFSISAANTINNASGTDTSNGVLIVSYFDKSGA